MHSPRRDPALPQNALSVVRCVAFSVAVMCCVMLLSVCPLLLSHSGLGPAMALVEIRILIEIPIEIWILIKISSLIILIKIAIQILIISIEVWVLVESISLGKIGVGWEAIYISTVVSTILLI